MSGSRGRYWSRVTAGSFFATRWRLLYLPLKGRVIRFRFPFWSEKVCAFVGFGRAAAPPPHLGGNKKLNTCPAACRIWCLHTYIHTHGVAYYAIPVSPCVYLMRAKPRQKENTHLTTMLVYTRHRTQNTPADRQTRQGTCHGRHGTYVCNAVAQSPPTKTYATLSFGREPRTLVIPVCPCLLPEKALIHRGTPPHVFC